MLFQTWWISKFRVGVRLYMSFWEWGMDVGRAVHKHWAHNRNDKVRCSKNTFWYKENHVRKLKIGLCLGIKFLFSVEVFALFSYRPERITKIRPKSHQNMHFSPTSSSNTPQKTSRRYCKDVNWLQGFFLVPPQPWQSLLLCSVYISAAVMVRQFEPLPTSQGELLTFLAGFKYAHPFAHPVQSFMVWSATVECSKKNKKKNRESAALGVMLQRIWNLCLKVCRIKK